MDRDTVESYVKIGPNWIPLDAYKTMKAEREIWTAAAKSVGFLALTALVAFLLLWGTP